MKVKLLLIFISFSFIKCNQQKCDCTCADKRVFIKDLKAFKHVDDAIIHSEKNYKPILVQFTCWACSSHRKMDEKILPKRKIYNLLKNEFELVILYVDDRKRLPKYLQTTRILTDGKIKQVETVGKLNLKYQIEKFENNSQPFYAVLSSDGEEILETFGYLPDSDKVYKKLKNGIKKSETYNYDNF